MALMAMLALMALMAMLALMALMALMRITPGCASPPDAHHPRMRITPACGPKNGILYCVTLKCCRFCFEVVLLL